MGNTVLAQPEDAGDDPAGRVDDRAASRVSTDGNGRYTRLDPYAGAQLALAEAYRNVATTGARPLAVTNCLNFGSPEDPGRHVAVRRGGPRAGRRLPGARAPRSPAATSASTTRPGPRAILPTPVIGVLGVIDDVTRRTPHGFRTDGALVYLLGDTRDEFGGSEWAHAMHGFLGGRPPARRLRPRAGCSPTS